MAFPLIQKGWHYGAVTKTRKSRPRGFAATGPDLIIVFPKIGSPNLRFATCYFANRRTT
jgi:hypothetical protein